MQLQFEQLDYQTEAIAAITNLFIGQANQERDFTLAMSGVNPVVANHLQLSHTEIEKNLHRIQQDFSQAITPIDEHGLNFSVEMETGTGKTYVYLRTLFTLNQQYGWKKFVIVVPSVAIREGVEQSFRAMKLHFETLFDNPIYEHKTYNSDRLNDLRHFATSNEIQILIMNIDAFKKDDNVINRINESGEAPIVQVAQTQPIVIIDEPQNMETELSKQAINSLNPLFVLRYSATHKQPYHKVYSLNPIAAYQRKLVKQIEVEPVLAQNDTNGAYFQIKDFVVGKKKLSAKVDIHFANDKETKKKTIILTAGDDVYEKSGYNPSYRYGFLINGINAEEKSIDLSNGQIIRMGEDQDALHDEVMKKQIECTIKAHLAKEKRLNPRGIKVLSLFFIDKVANYRGEGKFARWFQEIYESETGKSAKGVHDGYFSQDKDTSGKSKADDATYHLIMRDKEKLLSFNSPLRFIFSHSALKEGWDNPNVFQICTLNETRSPIKKRQEIGRGLRLAVNQQGARIYDEEVNILTVIPNESYEVFAQNLQQEYEDECGIRFSQGGAKKKADRIKLNYRKGFTLDPEFLAVWQKLQHNTRYSVQFDSQALITAASEQLKKMPEVEKPQITVQKAKLHQSQTDGIWGEEVNIRAYHTDIRWEIPDVLQQMEKKTQLTRQTLFAILQQSGRIDEIAHNPQRFIDLACEKILLALHELMIAGIEYTKLPDDGYQQSLAKWQKLEKEGSLFFLDEYTFMVNQQDKHKQQKTIFADYISLDSTTEKNFAAACESHEDIRLYFKLPSWFKIPTPIGHYNPDWAVVKERDTQVYFVAETKNTGVGIQQGVDRDKLATTEQQKITCAEKHFAVLDGVAYRVVEKLSEL